MPYDPSFIADCRIPLPELGDRVRPTVFGGGVAVDHTRFSILFNQDRGFAVATAHNIDGGRIIPEGRIPRRDRFRFDPDVPNHLQVDDRRGYSGRHNLWDRGHLVRRRALHWGPLATARRADNESFFWTNISPQHRRLHHSAWGRIEDWILGVAEDEDKRVCVFTGPVFTAEDPEIVNRRGEEPVRIPAGFWKIVALKHRRRLRGASFLVWQRDFDRDRPLTFDPVLEQVRLTTVEYLTGLSFTSLRRSDPLRFGASFERVRGQRRVRVGSARVRPAAVTCAEDIVL